MMTVGIFNFYIGGSVNEAAALGFILIILGPPASSSSTAWRGADGGMFG